MWARYQASDYYALGDYLIGPDHLVHASEQCGRNFEPERFGGRS